MYPRFDGVTSDRWREFGWDKTDIAKVDPEVIHVNIDCKPLTAFRKTGPSSDEKKIIKTFCIAMYFHALMLNSELKDEQTYEELFKKTMYSIARAELPIIYDTKDIAIEKLIGLTT